MVFSVADNRVAHRRKLRSDLILQSCHQFNPDERSIRKKAFDGISKFGTSRLGVSRRAQLLKHSFTSKIVHKRSCLNAETAAQYREILPYGSMSEKLSHQRISIRTGLRKQQSPGGKTIDAMHDQGSLSLQLEFCNKQRQSGRSIGALNRHSQKSGRFVSGGVKEWGAWLAEKVSRLKLKQSSPESLGTFEALEFLVLGIHGKWVLWRALNAVAASDSRLAGVDFDRLATRAESQRDSVDERRLASARSVLCPEPE